jgi:hypothetical protein
MAQIETLFFSSAINMPASLFWRVVLSGALTAAFFAPLAVLILGKMRTRGGEEAPNDRLVMPWREWAWRLPVLAVAYACIYWLFGYFVAWQSEAVRVYYTGSAELKPFFAHLATTMRDMPWLIPFQLFRGLLWVVLALPVVRMMKGRPWESALALGMLFGLLLTSQLLLPNAFMPPAVRLAHFIETSTSTFLYGCLVGALLCWRSAGANPVVERGSGNAVQAV